MNDKLSVFCDGTIVINLNHFIWITMMSGVGLYLTGFYSVYYLCKYMNFKN